MSNFIEKIKEDKNTPIILAALIGFLAGLVLGFVLSPVKKGVTIGSNNCNNGNNTTIDDCCCEDEDCCCEEEIE
ncbi:MAG: hypothetical protein IJF18_07985 [Oscillospiraceae bacterium]|nr:hypothetical protein [Oscillospiraceae bacterium]